jgi:hypothetical protein
MILPGTSAHGMKLLLRHDGKVSLADLAAYEKHYSNSEIKLLKIKAASKPGKKQYQKILLPEDFVTWTTYKNITRYTDKTTGSSSQIVGQRKAIQSYSTDNVVIEGRGKSVMHFTITIEDAIRELGWKPAQLFHAIASQQNYYKINYPVSPVHHFKVHLGFVNFTISQMNGQPIIEIYEYQHMHEITKLQHNKYLAAHAMLMTEFIRVMSNDGFQRFISMDPYYNAYLHKNMIGLRRPMDAYSDLLVYNGFIETDNGYVFDPFLI